jgi:hypothetical protein
LPEERELLPEATVAELEAGRRAIEASKNRLALEIEVGRRNAEAIARRARAAQE